MKTIIILMLSASLGIINNTKPECKNFRTGKFSMIAEENNAKYTIERFADHQIEKAYDLSGNSTGVARYLNIVWESDCEYRLTVDSVKGQYEDFDRYANSLGGIKCRIAATEGDCAEIETIFDGQSFSTVICKIH